MRGTLEWYRATYMNDGLDELVKVLTKIMKEANMEITDKKTNGFIRAIMFGAEGNGIVRKEPPKPDMKDLQKGSKGQDKFKFENMIFQKWVRSKIK